MDWNGYIGEMWESLEVVEFELKIDETLHYIGKMFLLDQTSAKSNVNIYC